MKKRPMFGPILLLGLLVTTVVAYGEEGASAPGEVHMANGFKVGEVTQHTAIVWTRLTRFPERNVDGHPFPDVGQREGAGRDLTILELTGGHPVDAMEGSAPGVPGETRVVYWLSGSPDAAEMTDWMAVDAERDFTRQFSLAGLTPGTQYALRVEGRATGGASVSSSLEGRFRTAPAPDRAVSARFVAVTCHDYPRRDDPEGGHLIYDAMLKLDPDFYVHTGDIEYYDRPFPYAPHQELARFKWNRLFAMPLQRQFFLEVTSYFMKDDHDTVRNDCWPGMSYGQLTWEQGLAIFREQVPMGDKTYRTARWGTDLQVWMVEGRDYRSPNDAPDGPGKTIWGGEQKDWFMRTVRESDATFRILLTPSPMVGPDRDRKNDNYANAGFAHEGAELRRFLAEQDMLVITGDRHWQYHSVDGETGLNEFGTGPGSDEHAGGWSQDDFRPEHRYLNLKGGFLEVTVHRDGEGCTLTMRHRGVTGEPYYETSFTR